MYVFHLEFHDARGHCFEKIYIQDLRKLVRLIIIAKIFTH